MNANELQEMLNELLAAIQEVLQSGEELSDEIQGALADTIGLMLQRIDELRAQGSPADGLPPGDIGQQQIQQAMPSSNVEGFAYDDKTGKLLVRFLGNYPNKNGPIYAYSGVPKEIFDMFQKGAVPARTDGQNKWGKWWKGKVPSIGASLYTLIKTRNYPYQKIS